MECSLHVADGISVEQNMYIYIYIYCEQFDPCSGYRFRSISTWSADNSRARQTMAGSAQFFLLTQGLEPIIGSPCVSVTCWTYRMSAFPLTPPMPAVSSHRGHESGNFELSCLLCANYAFVHANPFSSPFTHTRRA